MSPIELSWTKKGSEKSGDRNIRTCRWLWMGLFMGLFYDNWLQTCEFPNQRETFILSMNYQKLLCFLQLQRTIGIPKYNSFWFSLHFECCSLSEENFLFYVNRDSFFAHCYAEESDELYWKFCKNLTILWKKYSGHIHFMAPFIFYIMENVQNSSSNFFK